MESCTQILDRRKREWYNIRKGAMSNEKDVQQRIQNTSM